MIIHSHRKQNNFTFDHHYHLISPYTVVLPLQINSIRDHNKTIPPLGKVEGPPEPVDTELPDVTPSISDDGELLEFDEEPEPANVDFADFEL